jgi:hypothetical protein
MQSGDTWVNDLVRLRVLLYLACRVWFAFTHLLLTLFTFTCRVTIVTIERTCPIAVDNP